MTEVKTPLTLEEVNHIIEDLFEIKEVYPIQFQQDDINCIGGKITINDINHIQNDFIYCINESFIQLNTKNKLKNFYTVSDFIIRLENIINNSNLLINDYIENKNKYFDNNTFICEKPIKTEIKKVELLLSKIKDLYLFESKNIQKDIKCKLITIYKHNNYIIDDTIMDIINNTNYKLTLKFLNYLIYSNDNEDLINLSLVLLSIKNYNIRNRFINEIVKTGNIHLIYKLNEYGFKAFSNNRGITNHCIHILLPLIDNYEKDFLNIINQIDFPSYCYEPILLRKAALISDTNLAYEIVKVLSDKIKVPYEYQFILLSNCLIHNNLKLLKYFITELNIDVTSTDHFILRDAIYNKNISAIKLILKYGYNVNCIFELQNENLKQQLLSIYDNRYLKLFNKKEL